MRRFLIWTLFTLPLIGQVRVSAQLERVVGGLQHPVAIANAGDGSGRLFVAEIEGRIRVVEDGQLLSRPYLDISDRVALVSNGGLLGLAFHPDYSKNGRFFVYYIRQHEGQIESVISEFGVLLNDPNLADSREKILLSFSRATAEHPGGDLAFGPDGQLYISSGDDGLLGDPESSGQHPEDLLGKILRVNVDQGSPYLVPNTNPFLGREGYRPEIWSLGFRNPFRMAFDPAGGRLFVGDVGEARLEEIDIVRRGENYGWNRMEGTLCFPPDSSCDEEGLTPPIHAYGRSQGSAVIGGRVYRGRRSPSVYGAYLFGDFVSRRIWLLREVGPSSWQAQELLVADFMPVAFGEDEEGELYLADLLGGTIYRLYVRTGQELPSNHVGLPIFANGLSGDLLFRPRLILSDPGVGKVVVEAKFFDRKGHPNPDFLALGSPDPGMLQIPAGQTVHVSPPLSSELQLGWLEFTSANPIQASLELSTLRGGEVLSTISVSPSALSERFIGSMVFDPAAGESTALALVNPFSDRGLSVSVLIRDQEYQIRGFSVSNLGPHHSQAFFLDQSLFEKAGLEGTLVLESEQGFEAALFRTREGVLTTQLDLAPLPRARP